MSSVVTSGASKQVSAQALAATDVRPGLAGVIDRLGVANVALAGVTLLSFGALFFRWMNNQFGPEGFSWKFTEDWGHAYVVPLISGYYIWKRREWFARQTVQIFWPGAAVLLLGIVCYPYFIIGFSNHMFQGFALILALAGLALMVLGPHMFRGLVFPLAYLGFAVTISQMIMIRITWVLKLLASQGSEVFLALVAPLFGADVSRNGNILNVYHGQEVYPLNVADACAGMRMVVAFVALAVAVAFISCNQWWQRVMVMLLAVPVALLMNVLRVGVLGLLTLKDPELAVGNAHTFVGTLLLIPAFGVFMACVWAVRKITPDEGRAAS